MSNALKELPYKYSDQPLIMSVLMTPEHVNFGGKAHGGFLLRLLDECAYICAARHCGGYAVTAAIEQAQFLSSISIGDLVSIYASLDYTGRTSMEVSLNVVADSVREKSVRYVHNCFITMVAVDDEAHRPVPVKAYIPQTEQEKIRFAEAKLRRELRLEYKERLKQLVL